MLCTNEPNVSIPTLANLLIGKFRFRKAIPVTNNNTGF
jgi:hypothetical protein